MKEIGHDKKEAIPKLGSFRIQSCQWVYQKDFWKDPLKGPLTSHTPSTSWLTHPAQTEVMSLRAQSSPWKLLRDQEIRKRVNKNLYQGKKQECPCDDLCCGMTVTEHPVSFMWWKSQEKKFP